MIRRNGDGVVRGVVQGEVLKGDGCQEALLEGGQDGEELGGGGRQTNGSGWGGVGFVGREGEMGEDVAELGGRIGLGGHCCCRKTEGEGWSGE